MKHQCLNQQATISENESMLQGVAQEDLIGYSDVVMCFVSPLNVTNVRAASHWVMLENRQGLM